MKLNLGCGYNKLEGYTNLDSDPACNPDVLCDLEGVLPFEDSSAEEIVMVHILEHLGQTTKGYLSLWQELYRVCQDQAVIKITVPHHMHENFHHDPTHVRKVTPVGIDMFNQERNRHTIETGGSETTLGLQLGIDIRVQEAGYGLMPAIELELKGQPYHVVEREVNRRANICHSVQINAKVFK